MRNWFLYSCWWEASFMKVNEFLSWDDENTFAKRSCEIFPIEFSPTWSHIMLFILENFQSGDDFKAIKWIKGKAIVPSSDWKSNKNVKTMKALPAQYYIWGANTETFSFRCQQLATAPIHSCLSLKSQIRYLFSTYAMNIDKNSLPGRLLLTVLLLRASPKTFSWSECLPPGWMCLVINIMMVVCFWRLSHESLWSQCHRFWLSQFLFLFQT